ncbi:MAG TPA: heparin lyase I family protein, partial [Nitrolancea sp.]|nr:heparin lyase I family protein [Nitrolancea sp.]
MAKIGQTSRSFLGIILLLLALTPTAVAATRSSSQNNGNLTIYADALSAGWHDQSWNARVTYTDTRQHASGRASISFATTNGWGGLDMRTDSGISGSTYGQLTFALKASRANQPYAVYLRDASDRNLTHPLSLAGYGGQPVPNRWTTYTIPLNDLGAYGNSIGHIVLQDASGAPQPAVYVDDIALTGHGQPPVAAIPTATPTETPTPTPIPSPTATATATPEPAPATEPSAPLASATSVIWSADNETGNLDQWTVGQYGEAAFNSGTGDVTPSTDVAHSGKTSLKMAITDANGSSQAARIFRWNDPEGNALPESAYYSVWYYFPEKYTPAEWWNVMQFKSRTSASSVDPMWVLNVGNRANGNMYFYLWDAMHKRSYDAATALDLPVAQWMHIEVYFRRSTGASGQITIWQDGVKLFDLDQIQTTTADNQQWSLSNYTDNITPSNPV